MKTVSVMQGLEDVDENNIEKWLNIDSCDPSFQHMTDDDIVLVATNSPVNDEDEGEEGNDNDSMTVSHSNVLQCCDTLLEYMDQ